MTTQASAQSAVRTARGRPPVNLRAPEETKAQLLDAALDVFAERGYVGASIKAIAERAGVTSGTIYCHFKNKADLLVGVIKKEVSDPLLLDRIEPESAIDDLSPRSLARLVARYASARMARARRLSLELHAASAREDEVAKVHAEYNRASHAMLCAMFEAGKARSVLPSDLPVGHTAHLFHTLILGLSHTETLEPSLIGDAAWMEYLEESVVKILCCEPKNQHWEKGSGINGSS